MLYLETPLRLKLPNETFGEYAHASNSLSIMCIPKTLLTEALESHWSVETGRETSVVTAHTHLPSTRVILSTIEVSLSERNGSQAKAVEEVSPVGADPTVQVHRVFVHFIA